MRKLIKVLSGRLFWTILIILLQFAFLFYTVFYMEKYQPVAATLEVLGFIVALVIFSRDDSIDYKFSWIMVVLFSPVFGSLLYLLLGRKKENRREIKNIRYFTDSKKEFWQDNTGKSVDLNVINDPDQLRLAKYVQRESGAFVYGGTRVNYYPVGDYSYEVLISELKKARKFIFMEYFIFDKGVFFDNVLEILKEKVASGVKVCVIYDDMGSINTLPLHFNKKLRKWGIDSVVFNPVRPTVNPRLNYRDHRKMCVIDGNTVISGGINIADEYINKKNRFGHWKDNIFVLKGDGVWNYTLMFIQLWNFSNQETGKIDDVFAFLPDETYETDGLVQSFGDNPFDDCYTSKNVYIHLLNTSKERVWICTPYLILDNSMIDAISLCALSGVDVRIITPAVPDKKIVYEMTKSNYKKLLNNGVKIYEYQPGFIHSKVMLSDDKTAVIGTANFDFRSFFLHFECGSVFYGGNVVSELEEDFLNTLKVCKEIKGESIGIFRRFFRVILKIVSPML